MKSSLRTNAGRALLALAVLCCLALAFIQHFRIVVLAWVSRGSAQTYSLYLATNDNAPPESWHLLKIVKRPWAAVVVRRSRNPLYFYLTYQLNNVESLPAVIPDRECWHLDK